MNSAKTLPSVSLFVATIALVVGLGGAALAAPPVKKVAKNAIKSKQIAKNAVKSAEIAAGAVGASEIGPDAVGASQIADGAVGSSEIGADAVGASHIGPGAVGSSEIGDDSVTGDDVLESSLGPVPAVQGAEQVFQRLTPSATGADQNATRAAATKVTLYSAGPFTVYAKCYKTTADPANPAVRMETFIETSSPGAIYSAAGGNDSSNGFIDPSTAETSRALLEVFSQAGAGNPGTLNITDAEDGQIQALVDETILQGSLAEATKVGSPAVGDGVFGAGDRCLVGGTFNSN